jgi:hypothetical protein
MPQLSKRESNAISNLATKYNISFAMVARLYLATFDNILYFSVRCKEEFLLKLQEILVEDSTLKGTEEKILKTILSTY